MLHIHHDLLPQVSARLSNEQVWIGGGNKSNADYAGPPHELVRPYMDDLLEYVNTSGELPVVQAAIIHGHFETIHPFEDGNGRVGRALFDGVLKRTGLIDDGVIPLSAVLRDDVDGYLEALTRHRYGGDDRGPRRAPLRGAVPGLRGQRRVGRRALSARCHRHPPALEAVGIRIPVRLFHPPRSGSPDRVPGHLGTLPGRQLDVRPSRHRS